MRFTLCDIGGQAIVTGSEFKQLRIDLGEAIGRPITLADMAKLCGLEAADGADTIRRWEVTGPAGPVAELLRQRFKRAARQFNLDSPRPPLDVNWLP